MLRESRHRLPHTTGFQGRGCGFRRWLAAAFFLACCRATLAWDVEHDELAQLVGETLPEEIKSFYTFDDFGTLISYCHFPDMTEWAHAGRYRGSRRQVRPRCHRLARFLHELDAY